jgi:hypothetical protein
LTKLDAARRQAAAPVLEKFTAALTALEAELTKGGKLDEALAVEEYRSGNLAERFLGTGTIPAPAAPAAPGKPTGVAANATKDQPFENQLGMRFVPVPITGGPTSGKTILFSIWETRVKDYAKFVEDEKRDWPKPEFKQGDDHPAVNVSWEDATAFADWLTKRERGKKRIGPKDVYRLPSDHEWSCPVGIGKEEDSAATPVSKSGKISGYPWGKQFPTPKGAGNFCGEETNRNPISGRRPIPGYDDGFDRTAPLGSFTPNPFGIYDLIGNVRERCQDWLDPAVPGNLVVRVGLWATSAEGDLNLSHRNWGTATHQIDDCGFRLVLEIRSND